MSKILYTFRNLPANAVCVGAVGPLNYGEQRQSNIETPLRAVTRVVLSVRV